MNTHTEDLMEILERLDALRELIMGKLDLTSRDQSRIDPTAAEIGDATLQLILQVEDGWDESWD